MRVRVSPANAGMRVRANQVETLGLGLDIGKDDYGLSAGYTCQNRMTVSTNTVVSLQWYKRDLFGVQAGTNFPSHLAGRSQSERRK